VAAGVARVASLKVLASMDTEESRAVMEEGLMVMVYSVAPTVYRRMRALIGHTCLARSTHTGGICFEYS